MALGNIYRVVQSVTGDIVPEVLCTVLLSGTSTLATLFADQDGTVALPNPLANNSTYGSYSLFVAAGLYDMQFVKSGYTFETQKNIDVSDPAAGVTSITGTANQVLVSPAGGVGAVTLALPQSIDPDASVQFGRLGLATPAPGGSTRLAVNGLSYFVGEVGMNRQPQAGYPLVIGPGIVSINQALEVATALPSGFQLALKGSIYVDTSTGGVVGIGTTLPTATLHVIGTGKFSNNVLVETDLGVTGGIGVRGGTPQAGFSIVATSGIASLPRIEMGYPAQAGFDLTVNGSIYVATGVVGLQTAAPISTLTIGVGSASKPAGGPFDNFTSSRALKQAIRPLTGALATLLHLQGRQWEWADDQETLRAQLPGTQTGLVLEEVLDVLPQWRVEGLEGSVGYSERGLLAYVVEALREVVTRLEALEARPQG